MSRPPGEGDPEGLHGAHGVAVVHREDVLSHSTKLDNKGTLVSVLTNIFIC